jgi:hypothetical protein
VFVGGFSILGTASHAEALGGDGRICRCPQEVCEIKYDPHG